MLDLCICEKICYTESDVDRFEYKGDLAEKLKMSLQYFRNLGITGVIQGDLMFTASTVKKENGNLRRGI